MPTGQKKPFLAVAAALVALLAAFSWVVVLRERSTRRLLLEYRVHQTLTALTELVRVRTPAEDDLEGVVHFGLYSPDGDQLYAWGDAPASLDPATDVPAGQVFALGRSTATMTRLLGRDFPGRGLPGGMMGGMMLGRAGREPQGTPAIALLRMELDGYWPGQYALLGMAVLATAALAGLYLGLSRLYGRYEATRLAQERNRELVQLGQAARTIVHEIKNPLGVISIQCGVLRRQAQAVQLPGLAVIEEEVARLASMAERIRGFLKPSGPAGAVIEAAAWFASFAARYEGRMSADLSGLERAGVRADGDSLREALDNLAANALEASPPGAEGERPSLVVTGGPRGLAIKFLDRGPRAAEPGRLFEPFYTTKEKGTGLGLALARKHVEAAGGAIEYEARPGGGSVFTVRLPAEALGPAPAPPGAAGDQPR